MAARLGGKGYASQQFSMPDGAEVKVRMVGGQQFLRIDGSGPSYEFFTSEHIAPINQLTGIWVFGSGTKHATGKDPKPLWSDALDPPPPDPGAETKWEKFPFEATASSMAANKRFFRTYESWREWKHGVIAWWPGNKSDSLVTSSDGIGVGRSNMAGWLGYGTLGVAKYSMVADQTKGLVVTKYGGGVVLSQAPALPAHIAWRRAAVHTAKSTEFGSREFFVMADSHGRFIVWPAKGPEALRGTPTVVPTDKFKIITPAYPDWVTLPDAAQLNLHGQWYWSFNKDATKVVGTPFNSRPGTAWVALETWDAAGTIPPAVEYVDLPYYRKVPTDNTLWHDTTVTPAVIATNNLIRGREDIPGLVELKIEFQLTGSDDDNYTAAFSVVMSSHALDSKRYYVDAAYLLRNERLGTTAEAVLGAPEDALITAEIEVYFNPDDSTANPKKPPYDVSVSSKHIVPGQLIRKRGGVFFTQAAIDPAVDAPIEHQIGFVGHATDNGTVANVGNIVTYTYPDPAPHAMFPGARRYPARIAQYNDPDAYYTKQHRTEPGFASAVMGTYFAGNVLPYYVVREHSTQKVIRKFPLSSRYTWAGKGLLGGEGGGMGPIGTLTKLYKEQNSRDTCTIAYADLRSLSFSLRFGGERYTDAGYLISEVYSDQVFVWNKEIAPPVGRWSLTATPAWIMGTNTPHTSLLQPEPPAEYVKLPYTTNNDDNAAIMCMQSAALIFVDPGLFTNIPVHPQGHWAFGAGYDNDIDRTFDIIQSYSGKKANKRKSHMEQFNTAFGQTRPNDYYGSPIKPAGSYGSFGTTGFWLTF